MVEVGKELTYILPRVVDREGNADPRIRIEPFKGQEGRYPNFMTSFDSNKRLTFFTQDYSLEGQTFYFTIIVEEEGSATLFYPYYCSVRVMFSDAAKEEEAVDDGGLPTIDDAVSSVQPQETQDFNTVGYEVGVIDHDGVGTVQFMRKVDMDFVEQNFEQMFTVFYRKNDYRFNPEDFQVKSL